MLKLGEGYGVVFHRLGAASFRYWNQGVRAFDSVVVRTHHPGRWLGVVGGPGSSTPPSPETPRRRAYEGTKDGVHYLFLEGEGLDLSDNGVDIELSASGRQRDELHHEQPTDGSRTPYGRGRRGVCTP
jgi:hypothetical protein